MSGMAWRRERVVGLDRWTEAEREGRKVGHHRKEGRKVSFGLRCIIPSFITIEGPCPG